jgi:hypothetical protein
MPHKAVQRVTGASTRSGRQTAPSDRVSGPERPLRGVSVPTLRWSPRFMDGSGSASSTMNYRPDYAPLSRKRENSGMIAHQNNHHQKAGGAIKKSTLQDGPETRVVQGCAAMSSGRTFAPPAIRGFDGSKCSRSSRFWTSARATTKASFRLLACRSATLKNASPK